MITIEQLNRQLFEAVEGMEGAEEVRKLLAAGADANACAGDGTPVLWYAVAHDEPDAEVVRALLEAGADADAAEGVSPEYTALAAALENGAGEEVLRLLREAGAREPLPEPEGEPLPPDEILPPVPNDAATSELLERAGCAEPPGVNALRKCLIRNAGELSAALRQVVIWGPKPSVVRLLLSAGADPNAADAQGCTALHRAVEFHAVVEVVRELLMAGADPYARDAQGRTAREVARGAFEAEYRCRKQDIVSLLLTAEAAYVPRPAPEELTQRLFEAIRDARADAVLTLLAEGAPANAQRCIRHRRKKSNYTALDYALESRAPAGIVHTLLRAGALPTPRTLPLAVDGEHGLAVVQELIAAGADVNGQDERGRTALMLAAESGDNYLTFRELLTPLTNLNITDDEDRSVLHYLLDPFRRVNVCALRLMLSFGADPNVADARGVTPLMLAMHHSEAYCPPAPILLEAEANPHARDVRGRTALHHAWSRLGLNAFRPTASRGEKPLQCAAEADIRALLAAGAAPTAPDNFGETPVDRMLRKGERRKNVLRLLQKTTDLSG